MRLVFAGTPDVAVPSLDALLASSHEVVAVVTRPDAPAGRGKRLTASPVGLRAEEAGIPVLKPEHPRDEDFVTALTELAPDCCPVVAYGALVPQRVLDVPAHGWVNLHFSLLPAWRGAAPVQHAVLAGDEVTGASTFRLVREMDAGPVFGTVTDTIAPTDTSGDLLQRLSLSGAELLVRTLDEIEAGTATPVEQPTEGVTLAPKITVADAQISWDRPAEEIDRLVRGCQPAPGAWTTFRGERFKVVSAALSEESLAPGRIEGGRKSVLVGTGTTALQLGLVQPPGKKAMAAADWSRGVQLDADEGLGAG
ncbi:methionyl-tRNA formyltransferase [Auraticoccus monumenti]|uniref:Methionyl-tRNA formyltransferase n=1 Tax=Auraticoccus monumenti TaxID=675864 RepID=A0A1G7BDJ2_9ACTN|nr:methionyl-tRNA formyltransferase [Auraticoccus monumenti]SDE25093.1 methionyl-tRNA formyltransferase [Auraticoccus monumenti]